MPAALPGAVLNVIVSCNYRNSPVKDEEDDLYFLHTRKQGLGVNVSCSSQGHARKERSLRQPFQCCAACYPFLLKRVAEVWPPHYHGKIS